MPQISGEALLAAVKEKKTFLIYGPAISGKTYSLWTLVKYLKTHNMGKLHLFDLDQKCESLVRKCNKEGLLDHLVVIRISLPDKVTTEVRRAQASRDLWTMFQNEFNVYHDNMDARTGGWKDSFKPTAPGAIFIDSLSAYDDMTLEYVMSSVGHDVGAAGTDARNDFGKHIEKMKETVKSFKSLPCMTGWIAHENLMQDQQGQVTILPNVIGKKWPGQLSREFNCVLFAVTEPIGDKVAYKWQVAPRNWVRSAGVTSRDDLPPFIPADFSQILD